MNNNSETEEFHSCKRLDFENEDIGGTSNFNTVLEDENNGEDTFNGLEKIQFIHSKILNDVIPKLGMEFKTEDDAYEFYNTYAYKVGFSIRRSKGHYDRFGKIIDRTFCCSCEGHREDDKRRVNVKNRRAVTRFGCLAKVKVNCRQTGKYRIIEFTAEHTHLTSSPNKSHLHRSQRRITSAIAAEIDLAENVGLPPKQSCDLLAARVGGHENLGITQVDYRNYLRTQRMTKMTLDDTGGILEYLEGMQLDDPSFFYSLQLDKDGLITNIFWADAKMRMAYSHFGDVVSFDTTYRKNKENRPFAMFLGVNHHKQTTVFGAALLYDETAGTFVWLFDTFVKAMLGKKPATILTDQDAAMAKALASQWPESSHRLCIWHLYQNAAKHLSGVFEEFRDFSREFSRCIYDYEEEAEFIQAWNHMLKKFKLNDNSWLKQMFSLKEKWALVYGRNTFCADMTTTQRSESMNSAIKKYVNYQHNILRFFHHFQRLVEDRRNTELDGDFKATQRKLAVGLDIKILEHAASTYTPAMYEVFKKEVSKAYDCSLYVDLEDGMVTIYKLVPPNRPFIHTVTYDSSDHIVSCSCKRFEFAGVLCSHILKVYSYKNIMQVPSKYILKRWTIFATKEDITKPLGGTNDVVEDRRASVARRYKDLCRMHIHVSTKAAQSEEAYNLAIETYKKLLEDVDGSAKSHDTMKANSNVSRKCNDNGIAKGIKKKERARGSSSRAKGVLEKARKKKRKSESEKVENIKQTKFDVHVPQQHNQELSISSTQLTPQVEPNLIDQHVFYGGPTETTSMMQLLEQAGSFGFQSNLFDN